MFEDVMAPGSIQLYRPVMYTCSSWRCNAVAGNFMSGTCWSHIMVIVRNTFGQLGYDTHADYAQVTCYGHAWNLLGAGLTLENFIHTKYLQ